MGPFCSLSALDFRSSLSRFAVCVASLLIVLLAIPPGAFAKAKPLNAATVHARVLKRGIDNPIGVELNNGVELVGRIIAINTDSFTMQLFNDPEPVIVNYADVIDLRTGPSRGFWIVTGIGIAAAAGLAIWGAAQMHNFEQQHQLPNVPQPLPIP
jgi:hypothetical protein